MFDILRPFRLKDIPLKPEMTGRLKLDETILQTLAALMAYDGEARKLLRCTLAGDLFMASPPVCCIVNKQTSGEEKNITFGDLPTTEIMIMADAGNSGEVWVNVDNDAGDNTGWFLDAGDYIQFSIENMSRLRLHTTTIGDRVIILRTV